MATLNKVMLIGNIGKDPELRYTTSGQAVTTFSLATSEKFKNKSGELEEKTEWHRVVLWGKLAEVANDYLAKGSTVYIEGRIESKRWIDNGGVEKFSTEIVASNMQILSKKQQHPGSADDDAG